MKNYLKYIAGVAAVLVLASCDPYEDYYAELDEKKEQPEGTLTITLNDDQYELLEDVEGGEDIAEFKNFESEDLAREFIPFILSSEYPALGNGSSALVTYDLYAPVRVQTKEKDTLDAQDYLDINESNSRLNSPADITKAAAHVWPEANDYDLLTLWYNYFANNATTVDSSKVVRYNGAWQVAYYVTNADYAFLGQSFTNFDNRATAVSRIPVLLDRLYPFAAVGDVRFARYAYTYVPTGGARVTEDAIVKAIFNGTNWIGQADVMPSTMQFGHDGATWVPDNTIAYTLVAADYKAIATNKGLTTPEGGNMNQYGNFERRVGNANEWDDTEVLAALDFLLNDMFPDAAEGQKYSVTFSMYNGAAGTETWLVIKEGGAYIRVEQ
jgi:hypothetical protein